MTSNAAANQPVSTDSSEDRLKITEIFLSLQGEARDAGWPTVFIRLTGCPLRCHYCDTAYAFYGGQWFSVDDVLSEAGKHAVRHVCVTGGEPLAQKACRHLLARLCDEGYEVSLETSGALPINDIDARVSRVLDIKTPGSGEAERNDWNNLQQLTPHDQIKFVICSREDFEWAVNCLNRHNLGNVCEVLFSPSYGQVSPTQLADWIINGKVPVRFQMQLHKQLWGDAPGR